MPRESTNILIGGEAGQGLATVGQLLAKSLVRAGYRICVTQDYMSRVRGGHNTFAIRVATPGEMDDVAAPKTEVDILVALNQETVELHKDQMADKGVAIMDEELDACQVGCHKIPFKELSPKPIFENVAALGALSALLGLKLDVPKKLIADTFKKKGDEIINQNIEVLTKVYEWVQESDIEFDPLPETEPEGTPLMMQGNEAIALGAMAAGANFCSFYPMTPSTSVPLTLIANAQKMGVVVEQVEDEIAAINMALGASYAGARALVATSGGGFALMVEGVSLSGMTETPVVVVLAQRPGPATGLPTRTGQEDLNLVLYAGHGEFPRAVLAPGSVEECFHLSHKAFDLAEKSQGPVFLLTDQFMADSYRVVQPFDLSSLQQPEAPLKEHPDPEKYERYQVTESGVSPRLVPGKGEYLVVADSDEHYASGHITEDHGVRMEQQNKRARKKWVLFEEIISPTLIGDKGADTLLVCWGSTLGPAVEAAKAIQKKGSSAAVLHFSQLWPLNGEQFLDIMKASKTVACVEGNSTGQFKRLIRQETGMNIEKQILRYDGLPFTAEYILEHMDF